MRSRVAPRCACYLLTSTHLRVLRRHLVRHAPPQPAAVQHVGLVDHGQPAAPLLRRGERELERPADLVDRVLAHVDRLVALRLVLAKVEAAQQLAGKRRKRSKIMTTEYSDSGARSTFEFSN